MGFLLQKEGSGFYRQLAADIDQAVIALASGSSALIEYVGELDAPAVVERLRSLAGRPMRSPSSRSIIRA
jgi:hypothetical protein